MNPTMIRYRVKPDRAQENVELIRAVYEQLHTVAPGHFRYTTLQLDDGVSFIHLFVNERDDGVNELSELSAFQEFVAGVRDRCDEGPVTTELTTLGSYRFLADGA
jgi:hypothetical protein